MIKQIPYLLVIALFLLIIASCTHDYVDFSGDNCTLIDHKLIDGNIYQQYHCELEERINP